MSPEAIQQELTRLHCTGNASPLYLAQCGVESFDKEDPRHTLVPTLQYHLVFKCLGRGDVWAQ